MKIAHCKIVGISPYSQSRNYEREHPKPAKETHDDYRNRTWQYHLHSDKSGNVFIPASAFKNCLSESAKFLSIQIPGKGKATYTKNVEAGVLVPDDGQLGIKADEVASEELFLPADGKRGSGKRTWKKFPVIPAGWETQVDFVIGDDTVTKEVFERILREAGRFIGLGRFRPRNNGTYGRFEVREVVWS